MITPMTPRSPGATQSQRPDWLPRSAFPFQSRFVIVDGKTIHYVDEGSGPALLLVSAGQWAFMFRDVNPASARRVPLPDAGLSRQRPISGRVRS